MATQKNRFALNGAMQAGGSEHWDYTPPSEAAQQYVRNHMDWTVVARTLSLSARRVTLDIDP